MSEPTQILPIISNYVSYLSQQTKSDYFEPFACIMSLSMTCSIFNKLKAKVIERITEINTQLASYEGREIVQCNKVEISRARKQIQDIEKSYSTMYLCKDCTRIISAHSLNLQ
jgi:hypothetical protein